MMINTLRISHRDTRGDGSGIFVREADAAYLRNKWRPDGAHNLVSLDVSTDVMRAVMVGEGDTDWTTGSWTSAVGTWLGARKCRTASSRRLFFILSHRR